MKQAAVVFVASVLQLPLAFLGMSLVVFLYYDCHSALSSACDGNPQTA